MEPLKTLWAQWMRGSCGEVVKGLDEWEVWLDMVRDEAEEKLVKVGEVRGDVGEMG
jgi:hypothetical protein